jgi:hypothetical protein
MAKRRAATTSQIVRTIPIARQVAPIIRVSAPRAAPKKKSHRRRVGAADGGQLTGKRLLAIGLGGAAFGYIEKTFPDFPSLPLVGRSGTIAIAAYFLSRQGGMGGGIVRDIALSGAAITGYQLGKTGSVSGDVMGEDGLAAQV